jgi:hypothetical protein
MTVINNVVVPRVTEVMHTLGEVEGKQVPWIVQAVSGNRIVKVSDYQHHRVGSGNAIHFFNEDEWRCAYGTIPTTEVNKDYEIENDVFVDLEQGECDANGTRLQEKRTGPLGKQPSDVRGKQGLRGGSDEMEEATVQTCVLPTW